MKHLYLHYGIYQVVGMREEIEEIAKIVFKGEAEKELQDLPEGKFVALQLPGWLEMKKCQELMRKFPSCELFIFEGCGDNSGLCRYLTSDAGKDDVSNGYIDVHSDGNIEFYDGWLEKIIDRTTNSTSITVKLTNGQRLRFSLSNRSIEALNSLCVKPLTLGLLSDIVNPYTMPNKRREFIDSLRASIATIDVVSAIEFESVTESAFEESDIEKLSATELVQKLSDITVLRFLNASLIEKETKTFDYTTNTLTSVHTSTILAMENPACGHYNLIEFEYKKPSEEIEEIVGLANADFVDMQYKATGKSSCVCTKCLSDFEVVRVPDEIDGLAVTGIGEGCFANLINVKKIILPCTVKSIGEGAFAGCKKLTTVVYADNPDSEEDFLICNKGKLVTLFTNKTSYVIPETVLEIGKNIFSNCTKLKEVTLRAGIKKLPNDSLVGCKTLKTINLCGNADDINVIALEKGDIREVILPDGKSVTIHDKYLFGCFIHTVNGMMLCYQSVAENLPSARSESAKFKIAMELLNNHIHEIDDNGISSVLEFAIKYAIGNGDAETLVELCKIKVASKMDFADLINRANKTGNVEIVAMILAMSGQNGDNKKNIVRHETPAESLPARSKLYIKVRFENNKAYSYFCKFNVREGDKVFVSGKMAGMPGEVIEIIKEAPSGRAAMYTLEVTDAYNVVLEEVDDLFDV